MLRLRFLLLLMALSCACTCAAHAILFADLAGIVHDAQHRPIAGAHVVVKASGSAYTVALDTAGDGSFRIAAVPFGSYTVTVTHPGFATVTVPVEVASGTSPVLHIPLPVASDTQTVSVSGRVDEPAADSATPSILLGAEQIRATPGGDRSSSLAAITDFVPGAYMTHDMLHMRGGHQVSWLLDGVQIPNTNISSTLGPQIDPRDIQYLQIDRGSYDAGLGDRTYGIFDVNPKSGFERNRQTQLILTAGSALTTDDQLSFGDHSERGAYYLSLSGNRSNYGLAAPTEDAVHNAQSGYGGFASLLFNKDAKDQFRLLTQLRADFFQIPFDPLALDYENQLYDSSGLRDAQHESDGVVAFTWTHSFTPGTLLAISPFYHYNSADYEPHPDDTPVATTSDRASHYAGLQASLAGDLAHNHLEAGLYAWGQHDGDLFAARFSDAPGNSFAQSVAASGGLVEEYASDNYKPTTWLTVIAGLRGSFFSGNGLNQTATSPRFGAALRIPRLGWVFRGFYGHFYQPPPLATVGGPALGYAQSSNTSFAPLHGERDHEHQFGVVIPLRGWLLDADTFRTEASDFLDHANIGESSIFLPVTIAGALIQGWELTLRSPQAWSRAHLHLAYSNQVAKQRGAITGGLICFPVTSPQCDVGPGYTPLDHDQRNTLNVGGSLLLPLHVSASTNIYYGSGFANGFPDPPSPYSGDYLPGHTTFDLQFSRDFGPDFSVAVNATNVANRRLLLDNSLTFGGFHQNDPRQVYAELRYRFHY